jgi:hypothetical protein
MSVTGSGTTECTCGMKRLKHLICRDRRRREGNICRTMHFASPSRLIGLLKATFANGATSLLHINSPQLVEYTITRVDSFARVVVRNSLASSPVRWRRIITFERASYLQSVRNHRTQSNMEKLTMARLPYPDPSNVSGVNNQLPERLHQRKREV